MRISAVLAIVAIFGVSAASAQAQGPSGRGRAHGDGAVGALLRMDGNGDGRITRQETEAGARAQFTELDKDGNGALSQTEVRAGMRARLQSGRAQALLRHDADRNGQLSRQELIAGMEADAKASASRAGGAPMPPREMMRDAGPGRRLRDGDRRRDPPDGGRRAGDANGRPPGEIAMSRREAPPELSYEVFSKRFMDIFQRADSNGNGTVTVPELQALLP